MEFIVNFITKAVGKQLEPFWPVGTSSVKNVSKYLVFRLECVQHSRIILRVKLVEEMLKKCDASEKLTSRYAKIVK